MKSLFLCMPFMDSKTLLTTMFSILMFRIFVVQWLFVLSFFVLLMLIKGGVETKGRQMLLYCCLHAIVILYHPPSGQCSGNEVQRVSQVILHYGGVYVCVYMCIYPYSTHLHLIMPFQFHWQKHPSHVRLCRPLFSFLLWILILSIMCWFIHLKTRCQ